MRRIPAIHACQSDVTIVCAFFFLFCWFEFLPFYWPSRGCCARYFAFTTTLYLTRDWLSPDFNWTGFFFIYLLFSLSLLKVAFFLLFVLLCFVIGWNVFIRSSNTSTSFQNKVISICRWHLLIVEFYWYLFTGCSLFPVLDATAAVALANVTERDSVACR